MIDIINLNWNNIRVTPNITASASQPLVFHGGKHHDQLCPRRPTHHNIPASSAPKRSSNTSRHCRRDFDGARGLAALLLAAIVAALVVVADQLSRHLDDGGLLAAWLVMWAVVFAALALFAGTARRSPSPRMAPAREACAQRRAAAARRCPVPGLCRATMPASCSDLRPPRRATKSSARQVPARCTGAAGRSRRRALEPTCSVPTLYEAMRRVNLGKYY